MGVKTDTKERTLERCERAKAWNRAHRELVLERTREYIRNHKEEIHLARIKLKIEVLTYYSNGILACVKCGFDDIRALSIDHIDGSGNEHRKALNHQFYLWLKKSGYPDGYQTLCMNCQWIKRQENSEVSSKEIDDG